MLEDSSNILDSARLIEEYKDIPKMPSIMEQAFTAVKNPLSAANELIKLLENNKSIAAKVIDLSNSSFFGSNKQSTTIEKAVNSLGIINTRNIIIALSLKQLITMQGTRELWEHSIKCAVASSTIAKEYKIINPDDAFLIGFLHDIGKILLNTKDSLKYSKTKYIAANEKIDLYKVEEKQFGTNHSVLGALISKKWQLSVIVTNCIRYHHNPLQSSLPVMCSIIYAADRLVQNETPEPLIDDNIVKKLNFSVNDPVAIKETSIAKSMIFLKEAMGL